MSADMAAALITASLTEELIKYIVFRLAIRKNRQRGLTTLLSIFLSLYFFEVRRHMRRIVGVMPLWDDEKDSIWMLPGYMEGVLQARGIPVIFPFTEDEQELDQLVGMCDDTRNFLLKQIPAVK